MSNPPTPEPSLEQKMHMTTAFNSFLHYGSISLLLICPALIALPPRKLDLYTFSLSSLMFASTNQLVKERTGASIWYSLPGTRLPPHAIQFQDQVAGRRLLDEVPDVQTQRQSQDQRSTRTEVLKVETKRSDWKTERLREEQRKLDEGQGYWDMIRDQIWEVWNQEEKKVEEIKSIDERIVKEREVKSLRDIQFPQAGVEKGK